MLISVLTLFPDVFVPILNSSILKRARQKSKLEIKLINIRDYAVDRHRSVDDRPYGGGVGMLLKIDVLYHALQAAIIKSKPINFKERIILLDPTGKIFSQNKAKQLTAYHHLILVCGHYEGIDYRINRYIDEKISVGRYILTGGEIPAMAICDAVARLIPGVLKKEEATSDESYSKGSIAEAPQYTRPAEFKGYKVPKALLSGNHLEIEKWKNLHTRKV